MLRFVLVPSSVETFRESIRRETFARALAEGRPVPDAARVAGLSLGEALEASRDPDTIELVAAISPEVAAALWRNETLDDDPLEIIERGAKSAALQLVERAGNSAADARNLLEIALKYRAAHAEAPAKVMIQLPRGQIAPLLEALGEFNTLLQTLIEEDKRGRASA